METLFGILGFIVGLVLFFFLLNRFIMIFSGLGGIVGLFIFCWVIGIILVKIAWWIAVIVGGIALILYLISKFTGTNSTDTPSSDSNENSAGSTENTAENTTDTQ